QTDDLDGDYALPLSSNPTFNGTGQFLLETVNFQVNSNVVGTSTVFNPQLSTNFFSSALWWQNSNGSASNPSGSNNSSVGIFAVGTGVTFSAVADPQWNLNSSSTWTSTSNWSPSVSPNGQHAVANFGSGATVTINSPVMVTLDAAK